MGGRQLEESHIKMYGLVYGLDVGPLDMDRAPVKVNGSLKIDKSRCAISSELQIPLFREWLCLNMAGSLTWEEEKLRWFFVYTSVPFRITP